MRALASCPWHLLLFLTGLGCVVRIPCVSCLKAQAEEQLAQLRDLSAEKRRVEAGAEKLEADAKQASAGEHASVARLAHLLCLAHARRHVKKRDTALTV